MGDSQPPESDDRARHLLEQLARASAELLGQTAPTQVMSSGSVDDLWQVPLPLRWELQVRYLWHSAADSFDIVAAILQKRASSSALAQVRLLLEHLCVMRWLVESTDARQHRAYLLARQEILDASEMWRRVERTHILTGNDAAVVKRAITNLKDWKFELKSMAKEVGLDLSIPVPTTVELFDQYGLDYMDYKLLSDIGSHVGLAFVSTMFNDRRTQSINLDLGGAVAFRAYQLSKAYLSFASIVELVGSTERGPLEAIVRQHYAATKPLLATAEALWIERSRE